MSKAANDETALINFNRSASDQVVNLVLQGKGGVGKSLIASFLAQFYRARGHRVKCVDTDPVNQTFSQYAGIGAQHLKLMSGNQIVPWGVEPHLNSIDDGIHARACRNWQRR